MDTAEGGTETETPAWLFPVAVLFGLVANLLLLTAPIFMLWVHDRVLNTRSVESLGALSVRHFLYLDSEGFLTEPIGSNYRRGKQDRSGVLDD